ncbi:MAG: type II toxin-antitoxin system RelE/ParE family toxin [Deltaproteobacteria bacterium]|nr:type II toxin-antitoxin system RelE/ParE family toxin [Deltaproteobacteria bacterium]
MASPCDVVLTPTAIRLLKGLDHAVFLILQQAIRKLCDAPELGKPLAGDLKGLSTWKVSRYRIVYVWQKERDRIVIVGAGLRKEGDRRDIYAILQRLHRHGVLADLLRVL